MKLILQQLGGKIDSAVLNVGLILHITYKNDAISFNQSFFFLPSV